MHWVDHQETPGKVRGKFSRAMLICNGSQQKLNETEHKMHPQAQQKEKGSPSVDAGAYSATE